MEAQQQGLEGLHLFPLSPTTRRRNRGRGVIVLDNMTASNITNNPAALTATPDLSVDMQTVLGLPTPSPDEMVIQARGRRQIPLTFSPDVHLTPFRQKHKISQLVKNSNSSMSRLLLPTRTSPRKRLTLTDSPPNNNNGSTTPSPDKMKRSPITKKFKLDCGDSSASIALSLKGLSQEQVVALMGKVISNHPELMSEVRELMPAPDLAPLEERLNYLKRNIFRALPNTRLESKTDSMAYNRVATHLLAFKKALVDQGKILVEANQWAAVLDYSLMAWSYVKATPVWDNPPHNNVRRQCFKTLVANCMQALKKGEWNSDVYKDVKNKLNPFKPDSDEILTCIKYIDQSLSGSKNL